MIPQIQRGRPALTLAPMEGVMDAPMRQLFSRWGAFDFAVSEFVRVAQTIPPAKLFKRMVPELGQAGEGLGLPVQVQILGGDPEAMAQAALQAVLAGAQAIDINFGCPAPTVNRHDGGATILKEPERVEAIVRAIRQALPQQVPVSAKLRLGWDDPSNIFIISEKAEAGGAAWLTIHARTKVQGYRPPALWSFIGQVQRNLSIPVVANGDIWTVDDLKRCQEITGCEHFMLGRGALADPTLSRKAAAALGTGDTHSRRRFQMDDVSPEPTWWLPLIQEFVSICEPFAPDTRYTVCRLKQWLKQAHLRQPLWWFDVIKKEQSITAILAFLEGRVKTPCNLALKL